MRYELRGRVPPGRKRGRYLGWSCEAETPQEAVELAKTHVVHRRMTRAHWTDRGRKLDEPANLVDEEGRKYEVDPWRPPRNKYCGVHGCTVDSPHLH